MDFSAEVLMYVQKVKLYLATNVEAREYFLGKGSEDIFLKHLGEIAQKNFDKQQDATLNKEQFELLRRTILVLEIAESKPITNEDNIFIDMRGYGKICLN
mgnify:FL=1